MRLDFSILKFAIRWTLNLIIILVALNKVNAAKNIVYPGAANTNDTHIYLADGKVIHRDKRFLIYSGGGVSKVIIGFVSPIETRDNVNWRTMNLAYNFQAQYVALPSAMYLWDRFSRSFLDQRRRYDAGGMFAKDLTRSLIYSGLEMLFDRNGKPGRQCLLKAICEAAEHPIARNNVFDAVVHLILTPNEDDADCVYVQAKKAGEYGAICSELYANCTVADGLLENISKLF